MFFIYLFSRLGANRSLYAFGEGHGPKCPPGSGSGTYIHTMHWVDFILVHSYQHQCQLYCHIGKEKLRRYFCRLTSHCVGSLWSLGLRCLFWSNVSIFVECFRLFLAGSHAGSWLHGRINFCSGEGFIFSSPMLFCAGPGCLEVTSALAGQRPRIHEQKNSKVSNG